jgi:hypothetical protein
MSRGGAGPGLLGLGFLVAQGALARGGSKPRLPAAGHEAFGSRQEVARYGHGWQGVPGLLKVIEWQIPDFDVSRYRARLLAMDNLIQRQGAFHAQSRRFLIEACKPGPRLGSR